MVEDYTHNTPFEPEENFTDKKYWLVWSEKDNEQEACHDGQSAQQDLAWPKSSNEPTIDDSAEDRANTCKHLISNFSKSIEVLTSTLTKTGLPTSTDRVSC